MRKTNNFLTNIETGQTTTKQTFAYLGIIFAFSFLFVAMSRLLNIEPTFVNFLWVKGGVVLTAAVLYGTWKVITGK